MKNIFTKIRTFVSTYTKTSVLIGIIILGGAYYGYKALTSTPGAMTYTLGTVQQGTIVASVTGTGQVSANRTLNLEPLASANVVYVGVTQGQSVKAGDLIAELDPTTAQEAVRDAEANVQSAQLALQVLQEPATDVSVLQAQDNVAQATASLATAYSNGYSDVSSTFLDLPNIMTGLNSILHGTDVNSTVNGQENISFYTNASEQLESGANIGKDLEYQTDAEAKYTAAETAYTTNFNDFKNTSNSSGPTTIQNITTETYTTAQAVADAVQSAQNLIQYYQTEISNTGHTPVAKSNTDLSTLSTYTTEITGHVSSLLSANNTITTDVAAVPEAQASLQQIQAGTDPISIQEAQLNVTKAQNSLQETQSDLDNYYVRAPFDGTISALNVAVGDPAGPSTVVATLIDNDQVVIIPFNEVDVAKVSLGDKATLTFDAIDGLTLTGKVTEIDTVGTVTQGVVNFNVTITLDSTDPRVKPGMSSTASVITQVDQNVLTVPSSAVKNSANGGSYVLAFAASPTATATSTADSETTDSTTVQTLVSTTPPQQIPVTIGISDDTNTEIDSGLIEGQQIVLKSVAVTTAKPATTAPSLLGGSTGGRGGAAGGAALRGL